MGLRDPVSPLSRLAFRGFHLQSHLFFPTCPLRNPRMLWLCHPVALARSARVAPPSRRRSFRTMSFLLPGRVAFFTFAVFPAGVFLAAFAVFGAGFAFAAFDAFAVVFFVASVVVVGS